MADTMTLEQVRDWHCRFAETHNEDDTNTFHTKMADAIDAAIKQREQDKRDASRFRWLRDHYEVSASRHGLNDLLAVRISTHNRQILDKHIDAAMAKESGNG